MTGAAHRLAAQGLGLLTVPGDIPLVEPDDIRALLAAHDAASGFTIVPARDEMGSNAILCSPADAVPLRFGDNSFFPHLAAARARGLEPHIVRCPRIALDIDTPDDLALFLATPSRTRARALLDRWGIRATVSPPRPRERRYEPRDDVADRAVAGETPSPGDAMTLADCDDTAALMTAAAAIRDRGHGPRVSYSRKVFIPLTKLCRDSCHYCTFAQPPRRGEAAYLSPDEVLAIARAGAEAGCKEALFTLGDKPELRYRAARTELARLGHDSTLSYLAAMAKLVLDQTGLLPHLNAA